VCSIILLSNHIWVPVRNKQQKEIPLLRLKSIIAEGR